MQPSLLSEPAAPCLSAWAPEQWPVAPDWQASVQAFFASAQGQALGRYVAQRLQAGVTVYPPQPLRALELTPKAQVRVVILGQDPYHGPGQAEGLAFSVAPGQKLPPSLRNIFKELERQAGLGQLPARAPSASGSLQHWARQGVLLLNTCLTVEQGAAASHAQRGWEWLTQALVAELAQQPQPMVFMLWGASAQRFETTGQVVATPQHLVLRANHPSPLSALRPPLPFLGCGHFGLANAFLQSHQQTPIRW